MKILHIVLSGAWAGTEGIAFSIANQQALLGHEVVIAVRDSGVGLRLYKSKIYSNVRLFIVPEKYKGAQAIKDFISEQLSMESECFDVVHGHLSLGARTAALFEPESFSVGHMHMRYYETQFKSVSAVIAVSPWQLNDVPKHYMGRVCLVPNFINALHLPLSENEINCFYKRYRLSKNDFIFGSVSRLHIEKGIDLLIKAFNHLKLPNAKLVIIGEGEYEEQLRELTKGKSNIKFSGFIPDAYRYMELFDVFVSPSRADSFGMSVLEALSQGVPVVASRTMGSQDILKTDGLLFEMDNLEDLQDKMLSAYHGQKNSVDISQYQAEKSVRVLQDFLFDCLSQRKIPNY